MHMNRTDTLLTSIIATVLLAHCLLLLLCCFSPFAWTQQVKHKAAKQRLVVQTIALSTPTATSVSQTPEKALINNSVAIVPPPKPLVEQKPVTAPTPKPAILKPAPTPTPTTKPVPKPDVKPAPKAIEPTQPKITAARQQLLKKAKENLSKALTNTPTHTIKQEQTAASLTTPKLIGELKSESLIAQADSLHGNSLEASYQDELVTRLKMLLQLPEYGTVDIELTLSRSGKVLKFKIMRDESANNRRYIEKNIPTMHFHPFGSSFEGKAEHTFVIRLSNAV